MGNNQRGKSLGELLLAGEHYGPGGSIAAAKRETGFIKLNTWNTVAGHAFASYRTTWGIKKRLWAWRTLWSILHVFWITTRLLLAGGFPTLNADQADVLAGSAQKFFGLWVVGLWFFRKAEQIVGYALTPARELYDLYDPEPRIKALLYVRRAELEMEKGAERAARSAHDEALKLLPEINDCSAKVRVMYRCAVVVYRLGASQTARDAIYQAANLVARERPRIDDQIPKLQVAALACGISLSF